MFEEASGLRSVELTAVVDIVLGPNGIDSYSILTLDTGILGQNSGESLSGEEERVIEEDLNVLREAFPLDRALISQSLTIENENLLLLYRFSRGGTIFSWLLGLLFDTFCAICTLSLSGSLIIQLQSSGWSLLFRNIDTDLATTHVL